MVQQSANLSVTNNVEIGGKSLTTNKKQPFVSHAVNSIRHVIAHSRDIYQFCSCCGHKDRFCRRKRDKTVTMKKT